MPKHGERTENQQYSDFTTLNVTTLKHISSTVKLWVKTKQKGRHYKWFSKVSHDTLAVTHKEDMKKTVNRQAKKWFINKNDFTHYASK